MTRRETVARAIAGHRPVNGYDREVADRVLSALNLSDGWQPIETAPKDGTPVDLLFPYPRGHVVRWRWSNEGVFVNGPSDGGWWYGTSPRWEDGVLLDESEWYTTSFPNAQPLGWYPSLPAPPASSEEGKNDG